MNIKLISQYLILAILLLGLVEAFSYAGSRLFMSQNIVIHPPRGEGYQEYLLKRDQLLGWPAPAQIGSEEFDVSGSRITPSFPDPLSDSCAAIFGDSFTWGAEVGPEHAYGNVLSELLGCRVANYGVGGYGTDQAVLRYVHRIQDPAAMVILGHYSDNILRNVNQLRDLTSGTRFGFKPRFVIGGDGGLVHIPIPSLELEDYLEVDERTAELLPYEYFVPDRLGGPVRAGFPQSMTLVTALFHFRVQARVAGVPSYAPFYDQSHPSDALDLTKAIMNHFAGIAHQRGQIPVVVLIPDEKDLRMLADGKPLPYGSLLSWLKQQDLAGPDIATYMLKNLGQRDVCELFVRCGGRSHYNPDGYALLARSIHEWIRTTGRNSVPGLGADEHLRSHKESTRKQPAI